MTRDSCADAWVKQLYGVFAQGWIGCPQDLPGVRDRSSGQDLCHVIG